MRLFGFLRNGARVTETRQTMALCALTMLMCITLVSCHGGDGTDGAPVERWEILNDGSRTHAQAASATGWRPISMPATFTIPGNRVDTMGHVWLRGSFDAGADPGRWYGISLGCVYHADEVFINAQPIGRRTGTDLFRLHSPRNYAIAPGVIAPGRNEVSVRLGIFGREYGGFAAEARILDGEAFAKRERQQHFWLTMVPFGIVFLYCGTIVLLLVFFGASRERKLLYSALGLAYYAAYILALFFPYPPRVIDCTTDQRLMGAMSFVLLSVPFFIVVLAFIVQAAYGRYLTTVNRIALPALALLAAAQLINTYAVPGLVGRSGSYLINFLCIGLGAGYFCILLIRLHALHRDTTRIRILAPLLSLAIAMLAVENAIALAGHPGHGMIATYGSPIIVVLFMALFIGDYARIKVEHARLYDQLQRPGRPPAGASDPASPDRPALTESAEEKLRRVIDFIREHYASDLSREGLAAAVDLNPSYLGRLFVSFTGEKIGEYVNRLRIEEAIRRLATRDARVIDIALSVGFESLSTFNRAFKRVTGTTPTEYQKRA